MLRVVTPRGGSGGTILWGRPGGERVAQKCRDPRQFVVRINGYPRYRRRHRSPLGRRAQRGARLCGLGSLVEATMVLRPLDVRSAIRTSGTRVLEPFDFPVAEAHPGRRARTGGSRSWCSFRMSTQWQWISVAAPPPADACPRYRQHFHHFLQQKGMYSVQHGLANTACKG
jgi:hypothetical protein